MNTLRNHAIEAVCLPVFECFCNYWQLNEAGLPLSMEKFKEEIESALENAKYKAESDPALSREYERVELPLIFFIDYMVKEGNFPFKDEWRELSRNYNELSGDEKFFNLLSESLGNPSDKNTIPVFFTMLGLGFDGIYANDGKSLEKIMRQCLVKISGEFDIHEEPIVSIDTEKRLAASKKRGMLNHFSYLRITLIASLIFLAVSFIVNFFTLLSASAPFRKSLSEAAAAAQQFEIPSGGTEK
ncbi:MAG: DotU family type IV/VI secretion system protein [Spirochaetaceae bacterium]|jgi:type VI protein secretion system component VasF|nr:DotU family type IV/VI secretion system protein [Spirochaetaceae bacterium]